MEITALTSEGFTARTTEDLVDEYPQGREAELVPAIESAGAEIEPYERATPVPIGGEGE